MKDQLFSILRTALVIAAALVIVTSTAYSQSVTNSATAGPIRSSPAYAEVLLRRTEIKADIDALSVDYTEANPKMIDLRYELSVLDKLLERIFGVSPSETGKLTLALGKLIVRQAELETDLARLKRTYSKDHPEVKRAARKVEIYDSSVREVLR